jgi:cytochrome c biogenesis protein CcdA
VSKRAMLFFAVIVAISTVYDFYRGYHETRSIIGGIVYVIFGLIVLAFFWWLYSKRPNSN